MSKKNKNLPVTSGPIVKKSKDEQRIESWCKANGATYIKVQPTHFTISRNGNRILLKTMIRRWFHLNKKNSGTFRGQQNLSTFLNSLN